MMIFRWILITYVGLSVLTFAEQSSDAFSVTEKMKGVSLVSPAEMFSQNPIPAITDVGANWVAVIPYAFSPKGKPELYFDNKKQWWGERTEGAIESIRLAQEANLKIMLKPQVWIPGQWIGSMDYPSNVEWETWEKGYRDYILTFAQIAHSSKVEVFCIGTELKISIQKREHFWRKLIKEIKTIYHGKLIYAANWDEYELVPFWKDLDYIGIDAYFPLTKVKTPSVERLAKAWQPTFTKLKSFSLRHQKLVVFSEFGYLSLDGCAHNTWQLEKKREEAAINEQAQANALEALFKVHWNEEWWGGGFIWKWYPNYKKGEGHSIRFHEGDYTPQNKIGGVVLKQWYSK